MTELPSKSCQISCPSWLEASMKQARSRFGSAGKACLHKGHDTGPTRNRAVSSNGCHIGAYHHACLSWLKFGVIYSLMQATASMAAKMITGAMTTLDPALPLFCRGVFSDAVRTGYFCWASRYQKPKHEATARENCVSVSAHRFLRPTCTTLCLY